MAEPKKKPTRTRVKKTSTSVSKKVVSPKSQQKVNSIANVSMEEVLKAQQQAEDTVIKAMLNTQQAMRNVQQIEQNLIN